MVALGEILGREASPGQPHPSGWQHAKLLNLNSANTFVTLSGVLPRISFPNGEDHPRTHIMDMGDNVVSKCQKGRQCK